MFEIASGFSFILKKLIKGKENNPLWFNLRISLVFLNLFNSKGDAIGPQANIIYLQLIISSILFLFITESLKNSFLFFISTISNSLMNSF